MGSLNWNIFSGVTKAREETSLEWEACSLSHPNTVHDPKQSQRWNFLKINYSSLLKNVGRGLSTPKTLGKSDSASMLSTNHGLAALYFIFIGGGGNL